MNEVTLVGIAGYARAGKDTAAQGLVDIGWTKAAFADPLKRALETLNPIVDVDYDGIGVSADRLSDDLKYWNGWDSLKTANAEVRRLLQVFGTEVGRNLFGEDFWVKQALDGAYPYTVFSDVRFKNEADAIREAGGIIIWIDNPEVGPLNDHASENSITGDDIDLVWSNDFTKADLQHGIRLLVGRENQRRGKSGDPNFAASFVNRPRSDDGLESDPDVNGSTAYSAGEWADPECLPGAYRVPSRLPAENQAGPPPVRGLHSPEGQGYVERPDSSGARYWRDGGAC